MSRRFLVLAAASAATLIAAAPAAASGGHPPKVTFAFAPAAPKGGEAITLTANATDEDHDLAGVEWDLDDDGTYETPGTSVTARLARGTRTVRARAYDARGLSATSARTIVVANGAPSAASISLSDATPQSGQSITLTGGGTDPDGDALSYSWDLDGNGTYDSQAARPSLSFMRGTRKVGLEVTDPSGASFATTRTIEVANAAPTGDFTWGPDATPLSNTTVHLTASGVADADDGASGVGAAWDLDDDGVFETPGDQADAVFKHPGAQTVALRLSDGAGGTRVVRHTIDVADRAPVADFDVNPTAPRTGEDVTLTSRGTDPDGGTLQLSSAWDLDGDGEFDDATGDTAHVSFLAGSHVVRLRVTDGDGASTVSERTLEVTTPITVLSSPASFAAPSANATAPLTTRPRQMAPFPVVRLRGRIVRRGVLIELLSIKDVPAAARVRASCRGAGCRGLAGALERSRKNGGRLVRTLSHRVLSAGAVLELRVTQPGSIGKLVRFTFRRNRPPLRYDGCLEPSGKAGPCA